MDNKFVWPTYPRTNEEFNNLMLAVDNALALKGLKPFQRPLHAGRLFWEAFGWGGSAIPPKELAERPGFDGDVLMAKSYRWYTEYYGEKLKAPMAYGFAPVKLGNALWAVRAGVTYGTVSLFIDRDLSNKGVGIGSPSMSSSLNVLHAIESFPQALANSLNDSTLSKHFEFHVLVHQSLQWREELPRTELFDTAHADYDASTDDVLKHRYGQARWAAQQAAEKTIKGLLAIAGTKFPTGGPNGHNLIKLGQLLEQEHGIAIPTGLLELASCSAAVRYAEEPSSQDQALLANHAVLHILEQLRLNPKSDSILEKHRKL